MRVAVSARGAAQGAQAAVTIDRRRRWMLSSRAVGLVAFSVLAASFISYMVMEVPLRAPVLPRAEVTQYWWAAAMAATVVGLGATTVVIATLRARRASPEPVDAGSARSAARPLVPRSLGFEYVPGWVVAVAAGLSLLGAGAAYLAGAPLWVGGLALLLPWIPLVAAEARWMYATYGIFAAFALLVLLQVLHMGEHAMQVGQLYVHRGDLAQSHGVFGQLDFELVHFVTDTMLWI